MMTIARPLYNTPLVPRRERRLSMPVAKEPTVGQYDDEQHGSANSAFSSDRYARASHELADTFSVVSRTNDPILTVRR